MEKFVLDTLQPFSVNKARRKVKISKIEKLGNSSMKILFTWPDCHSSQYPCNSSGNPAPTGNPRYNADIPNENPLSGPESPKIPDKVPLSSILRGNARFTET